MRTTEQRTGVAQDVERIAGELYAAPPGEFIDHRDVHVRRLIAAGERTSAAVLQKMRKPTTAAWCVNLLVSARRVEVEKLFAFGPALAAAQQGLDGEALKELDVRRQRVVRALVAQARQLAEAAGHRASAGVGYEIEVTLQAALADPAIAERVLTGRLVRSQSYAGFGPTEALVATPPAPPPPPPNPAAERRLVDRQRAADGLAEAREALDVAERGFKAAFGALAAAEETRRDLGERAAYLREQLTDLEQQIAVADREWRDDGKVVEQAGTEVERARKAVDAAARRLERYR